MANASIPDVKVEVDFTNEPTNATRVYTDVTSYVRQLSYVRAGRSNELQRTEPGTLTAVLDNRTGRFDPTNTTSPYYPNVKRMRWVRVSAIWQGTTYRRWTGLVETWSLEYPMSGKDAICTVTATDGLKVLNLYDLVGKSYGAQLTSARVSAILTDVGITASTVAGGDTTITSSGVFAAQASALAHLQDVEESESGLFFAEADGTIVFQNRHYRLTTANSLTSRGTIGDQAGDIRHRAGRYDLTDDFLYNTAAVTPSGGTVETATDATSKTANFERRFTRSILSSSQSDALNTAQYIVQRYANPSPRVPQVEVIGASDPSKWATILSAVNSDRFAWRRTATGHTILVDVYLERVSEDVTPGHAWVTKWDLSPLSDVSGWLAGDATYSLAGQTTKAVY